MPMLMYGVSVLIMAVSLPLIFRKIPKNMLYGLRTRRTMSGTDAYWLRPIGKRDLECFWLVWRLFSPRCWCRSSCRTHGR